MADLPWFPHTPAKWRQRTAGLSPLARAAYHELLDHAWEATARDAPPCTLPANESWLANMSGFGPLWKKVSAEVRSLYTVTDAGLLFDGWLLAIWEAQQHAHATAVKRASAGGTAKADKERAQAVAQARSKHASSTQQVRSKSADKEKEEAVLPAPNGARVVLASATEGAPAPEGAALPVAKSNGDYQDRPSVREALMRRGVRPEQLNAPHETFTIQDVAARRDDQQREYDAALGEAVTAFLGAMDPDEANRLERDARVTLRLAATGALPELKAQRVRALVVDRIRKAEGWPTVADWDGSPDAFSWLPGELRVQETAS